MTWLFLVATLGSASALAWTRKAEFEARVHGHTFSKVELESVESAPCKLRYTVEFEAPPEGYTKSSAYYRFHVRVRFDEGRSLVTPVFGNRGPGTRHYVYWLDTSADGCWANADHKVFGVDVQGCRGQRCVPDPFT